VVAQEAESLGERSQARSPATTARPQLPQPRRDQRTNEGRHGVRAEHGRDAEPGDHQASDRRAGQRRGLVDGGGQRGRRGKLLGGHQRRNGGRPGRGAQPSRRPAGTGKHEQQPELGVTGCRVDRQSRDDYPGGRLCDEDEQPAVRGVGNRAASEHAGHHGHRGSHADSTHGERGVRHPVGLHRRADRRDGAAQLGDGPLTEQQAQVPALQQARIDGQLNGHGCSSGSW
jgi:hypothetical protein